MKWIDICGDREFQALSEYIITFLKSISKAENILKNCEGNLTMRVHLMYLNLFSRDKYNSKTYTCRVVENSMGYPNI
jgi:hypothetical protein